MPTIITQFIKELAVPLIVCTATSVVQTVKGKVKKMDDKKLMGLLADMMKELGEGCPSLGNLEFDKLNDNQQSVAFATIDAISSKRDIIDFITTMMTMCATGDETMEVTAEDCKTIWQAILNDIALPYGIKFTIE